MWKKLSDISLLNNEEKRYNLPPKVEDQEGHPGLSDSNNPQIPHFRPESEHKEKDIEIQYNDALNPTLLPTDAKDMLEFPSKSNKVWVGGDHLDFDPEKSLAPYILQTTDSGSARTVYHSFSDINNIDELIKHASEITPEMEEWFEERTNKHIGLVQKYCKRIYEYDPERFEEILELGKEHDQSKFKDPERTPYIKLTWKHKFDNYDSYKKPGTLDDKEINRATVLHVKNNEHHPEHWTNQTNDLINEEDRDKPPDKIIDATKMPDINIGTMCADWAAMSEEH